ncbi:MAG: hypothetical protein ABIH38_04680 [Patescibacteria group bacterium]
MFDNKFNSQPQSPGFRQMRLNGRCPICQAMYDFQKLQILGEQDQSILVYLECPVCSASILSVLSMDPRGMSAQGMVTDLTSEEVFDLGMEGIIEADDVLAMHELLESDKPVDVFLS